MWIVNLNDDIRDGFVLYPIVHCITNTLTFIVEFRIADFFLWYVTLQQPLVNKDRLELDIRFDSINLSTNNFWTIGTENLMPGKIEQDSEWY